MAVLDMTIVSIATGLIVSAIWLYVVWSRARGPGESWEDARKREMAHMDRLAELDYARIARDGRARLMRNAELAEIPETVRSRRNVN